MPQPSIASAEDIDLAADWEPAGCRWIRTLADGTWRPCAEEDPEAIYAALLALSCGGEEIKDIVAWELVGPGIPWWRRVGLVSHLGFLQLEEAERHMGRVKLVATPREWMRDRATVCILDWRIDVGELFSRIDAVDCGGNDALKRTLTEAIKRQALRVL